MSTKERCLNVKIYVADYNIVVEKHCDAKVQ